MSVNSLECGQCGRDDFEDFDDYLDHDCVNQDASDSDDDPGAAALAVADGGVSRATWSDLSGFQRDILRATRKLETELDDAPHGLGIKHQLEEWYDEEVHHGRLYPNLDRLADRDLVEKGELDKRTNWYALTPAGNDLLGLVTASNRTHLPDGADTAPRAARTDGGQNGGR